MIGAFGIVQQGGDVVVAAPGLGAAEIHRNDREVRRGPARPPLRECRTEVLTSRDTAQVTPCSLALGGDVSKGLRGHSLRVPEPDSLRLLASASRAWA